MIEQKALKPKGQLLKRQFSEINFLPVTLYGCFYVRISLVWRLFVKIGPQLNTLGSI